MPESPSGGAGDTEPVEVGGAPSSDPGVSTTGGTNSAGGEGGGPGALAPQPGSPHGHVGTVELKSVSIGLTHACGVRLDDDTVLCWGDNTYGQSTPPSRAVKAVGAGYYYSCVIELDDTLHCWGDNAYGKVDAPSGTFSSISTASHAVCAIRTDGAVLCWGAYVSFDIPSGEFSLVDTSANNACGIRTDGTLACWGQLWQWDPIPSGTFVDVSAEDGCGVRADHSIVCWSGDSYRWETPPPEGAFTHVAGMCGIREADQTVQCWGYSGTPDPTSFSPHQFTSISVNNRVYCGLQTDHHAACWGGHGEDYIHPP